jgi:hypothetical protein
MMMIRTCLSLIIATVTKDLSYDPGSQARRLTVFSSYRSFADFREANFSGHFV